MSSRFRLPSAVVTIELVSILDSVRIRMFILVSAIFRFYSLVSLHPVSDRSRMPILISVRRRLLPLSLLGRYKLLVTFFYLDYPDCPLKGLRAPLGRSRLLLQSFLKLSRLSTLCTTKNISTSHPRFY